MVSEENRATWEYVIDSVGHLQPRCLFLRNLSGPKF